MGKYKDAILKEIKSSGRSCSEFSSGVALSMKLAKKKKMDRPLKFCVGRVILTEGQAKRVAKKILEEKNVT